MARRKRLVYDRLIRRDIGKIMEQYSPEIVAILGVGVAVLAVGVAVAGLILQQGRRLDGRIDALAVRMDEQDRRTDDRFRQMTDQMTEQYRQLTEQMTEQYRQTTEQHRQLTEQMNERFRQLTEQMNERFQNLSDRVARVEGKLDLLETFVAYRSEPPAEAAE